LKDVAGDKEVFNYSGRLLLSEGYRKSFSLSCTTFMFEVYCWGGIKCLIAPTFFKYDWRVYSWGIVNRYIISVWRYNVWEDLNLYCWEKVNRFIGPFFPHAATPNIDVNINDTGCVRNLGQLYLFRLKGVSDVNDWEVSLKNNKLFDYLSLIFHQWHGIKMKLWSKYSSSFFSTASIH